MTSLGIGFAATLALAAHAQENSAEVARRIFELTNRDRQAHNLQPLQWNGALAAAAQAHADRMVVARFLSHDYPGEPSLVQRTSSAGAHFQAVAENIATGFSAPMIDSEWMHSATHRANILDPRMNALGVGLVERNGTMYAVEDFSDESESLSPRQVEQKVGELLRREGINPSAPRHAATLACQSHGGYPPGLTSGVVIGFDTGDLTRLPNQVVSQIHRGDFRSASVAACGSGESHHGFESFKVAIVLY
jgi:hypothetical protein